MAMTTAQLQCRRILRLQQHQLHVFFAKRCNFQLRVAGRVSGKRVFSSGDGYRAERHEGSASAAAACPEDEENLAGMRVGALRMMQHGAGRSIGDKAKSPRKRLHWAANMEDPTKEVRRSNIDERQFLTNDAEGKTVFERARSASRNRLQRSVVAAAEYRNQTATSSAKGQTATSTEDRDLEEIEQDVEEQIQIAIANGEFDNLEGKGKPLKSSILSGPENPYLNQADRIGYGLLQKHGFAPEWIEQQKRIHRDLDQLVRELSESWTASKFEPTHAWVTQKDRFRQQMAALNKRVRDYNLNCPSNSQQMLLFDPVEEVRRAKRQAEARQAQKVSTTAARGAFTGAGQTAFQALFSRSSVPRKPVPERSVWSRVASAFKFGS